MKFFTIGRALFYFITQGGSFAEANTIYFWPIVSLTQERKGIPFEDGRKYEWLWTFSFLFWTTGLAWRTE